MSVKTPSLRRLEVGIVFTRCRFLQQRLQVRRQLHNVIRRSGPEHETVPGVLETRLEVWILQP